MAYVWDSEAVWTEARNEAKDIKGMPWPWHKMLQLMKDSNNKRISYKTPLSTWLLIILPGRQLLVLRQCLPRRIRGNSLRELHVSSESFENMLSFFSRTQLFIYFSSLQHFFRKPSSEYKSTKKPDSIHFRNNKWRCILSLYLQLTWVNRSIPPTAGSWTASAFSLLQSSVYTSLWAAWSTTLRLALTPSVFPPSPYNVSSS